MKVNKAALLVELEESLLEVAKLQSRIEEIKRQLLPRKRTTPKTRKTKEVDETEE